jgi:hypothetical protein
VNVPEAYGLTCVFRRGFGGDREPPVARPGGTNVGYAQAIVAPEETDMSIQPPVLLAALVFTAVYAGVVLPAVWSRKPARRNAALRVLTQLLTALRRRRGR